MSLKKQPALTEAERKKLIEWNRTQTGYPDICVHDLFATQAERTPDVVALMADTNTLTYRALNKQANQLAHHLLNLDVKPDDLIGICVERSLEMVVGILGILKAGAAYVPLDPSYPRERLEFMLSEAEIKMLLTNTRASLPSCINVPQVIYLDRDRPVIAQRPDQDPLTEVQPRHLAYVIYTSGSTGQPKGGAMEHRSLVNLLWWHAQTRPNSVGLKTLQFCAISFDFSFHEIFSTLCFGGTLVLLSEAVRHNPFAMAKFIADNAIEKLFLPVTALQQWAEAVSKETVPASLREVLTTGEQLKITPAMVRLFYQTGALLHNHYGATEFQDAATFTLGGNPSDWPMVPPIGRPLSNVQIYILDESEQLVPIGEVGELYIGGEGLARGYLNNQTLTRERFIANPFGSGRLYKTGDLARYRRDGAIENLGRADDQVKIRGIRIELGEVEAVLARHPAVGCCAVIAHDSDATGDKHLLSYVVSRANSPDLIDEKALHGYLSRRLPNHMLPESFVLLDEMPLTPTGKIDRRALPIPKAFIRTLPRPVAISQYKAEQLLTEIWHEVLARDAIGIHDNFFDIGGSSLLATRIQQKIHQRFSCNLPALALFQYPTIHALAQYLTQRPERNKGISPEHRAAKPSHSINRDIAIIGMSGRFPGAEDLERFWQNLRDGIESISFFSDAEVEQSDPGLLRHPDYVKAGSVMPHIRYFDAAFFGISPTEAATMDPQQRLLLECAWEAFENAGYNPETYTGQVGVYAGSSISTYLLNNVLPSLGYPANQPFTEADKQQLQVKLGNDRNYLPTRISYKLNLKGPSVNVQTACSTALVAVHLARQSLLSGECDMALAGGMSIIVPDKAGYLYEEGMIRSPDGHCRAFDYQASGTLFANGGGVVLLKRLDKALAEGDHIVAVVKGTAVNNDGALKVGFTAPSYERQVAVIEDALAEATVDAGTISYVEAHGTGTKLGDPIEIAALTRAFQNRSAAPLPHQYCAVGSVKTNIGHLDEAAGIAGLIKAALALQHQQIPPNLHFKQPNPQIDFTASPFYVETTLSEWHPEGYPRRAGVSSFGMGGTNSHLVLEEAPTSEMPSQILERDQHLLGLSAKTPQALAQLVQRYVDYLASETAQEAGLANICFTANTGRQHFSHRAAFIAGSNQQLRGQLVRFLNAKLEEQQKNGVQPRKIAFLFTGQGSQYVGMGHSLYHNQPVFRQAIERCDEILCAYLPRSLLSVLYPEKEKEEQSTLDETRYTQPALFAFEYALVQLWKSWGIRPDVVMGHSVGEYVAACVAGVFSLEDGLKLVAERGRLMQALPRGGRMVSVMASEKNLTAVIAPYGTQVAIAAINGPQSVVISGRQEAIDAICTQLEKAAIQFKLLSVSHAFHSPLMEPMLAAFGQVAQRVTYTEPKITLISNLSGQLASHEVTQSDYWLRHVRQSVRFAQSCTRLDSEGINVFLEIGPKPVLLGMARTCLPEHAGLWLPSLRPPQTDWQQLFNSLRELYLAGIAIDWAGIDAGFSRRRVPLPTYPWQRKYHWVEPAARRKEQKGHPLIGQAFHAAHSGDIIFQQQVSKESPAWLADHRVFQTMVMPGVAYLEMALAAGKQIFGTDTLTLSDFVMQQAMDWPDENQARTIQFVLQPEEANEYRFQIFSQATEPPNTTVSSLWTRHATGQIRPATQDVTGTAALSLYALQAQFKHEISADLIYRGELEREIDLGANFWATERLWREETSCLSKISLPAALLREAGAYQMHPVLLEACFLALTVAYPEKYGRRTYVPFGVEHLHWNAYAGTEMWCHAELHPTVEDEPALLKADLRLFTPDGRLILVMAGVLVKIATRQAMLSARKAAWQHWLYQVSWQAQQSVAHTALTGHWLILADQLLGAKLGRLLASSGANFTLLFVGEQRTSIAPDSFSVNPADPDAFRIILSGLPALQGVINCWSLDNPQYLRDDTDLERILILHNTTILHLVQALTALPAPPRLWLVTQGAQAVDGSPVQDAVAASGWGSGKVIALEHLELKCTQIDLDPDVSADTQAEMLLSELRSEAAYPLEDQVAFRHQKRYVARLEQSSTQTGEIRFRNDSSYLLTGGLGGLGLKVARFMAEHGAGSLVLVGRNAAQPAVRTELAEIEAFGAHLRIVQADVSDKDQMAQVLGQISSEHPLRGILHLAGVLDDALLQHQNPERFAKVLAPKAMGAWHLHTLTLGHELDFFVLFSSVTALLGAAGQANYAAANAFLDGLAGYRRAQGLPALSINWASWTEVGMSARLGLDERLIQKGEGVIPPAQGLAALAHLISAQAETKVPIGVLPIAWPRFFSQHQEVPAFLTKLSPARGTNKPRISFREQLAATPSQEREAFLEKLVQEQVLKVLGLDPSVDLDPETGFFSLAMDSLNSIEIRNQLQTRLACTLPTTLLFDYPTPKALVAYLAQMLFATTEVPGQAANGIQHSTLAPLQPHGSRPPLFFVPGILGMVFDLAPLARQLGKEQPFYGLRSLGLDEDVTPYKQINQIAAHHIKALQAVQPQGPYFLGGHSFGGKVAFEMAQQLQEQGHEIALLAIVDSCVPVIGDEKEAAHWDEAKFIATLAAYYENIFGQKLALAESHSLSPDKQLDQLIDQLAKANPKLKQSRSEVRRILEVYKGNMLSYSEYIPKIFHPTQITLLRAASVGEFDFLPDEDFTLKDPFWGWNKVADNTRSIDLHLIPGNHFTMMNLPNVQVLAERLQTCLAQLYQ